MNNKKDLKKLLRYTKNSKIQKNYSKNILYKLYLNDKNKNQNNLKINIKKNFNNQI